MASPGIDGNIDKHKNTDKHKNIDKHKNQTEKNPKLRNETEVSAEKQRAYRAIPDDSCSVTSVTSDICRICHCGESPGEELLSPCLCTGSVEFSHPKCLQQWLNISNSHHCELCHAQYQMTKVGLKPCSQWRWLSVDAPTLLHIALFFMCLGVVLASAVWWACVNLINNDFTRVYRTKSMTILLYGAYVPLDLLCLILAGLEIKYVIIPTIHKWMTLNQMIVVQPHNKASSNGKSHSKASSDEKHPPKQRHLVRHPSVTTGASSVTASDTGLFVDNNQSSSECLVKTYRQPGCDRSVVNSLLPRGRDQRGRDQHWRDQRWRPFVGLVDLNKPLPTPHEALTSYHHLPSEPPQDMMGSYYYMANETLRLESEQLMNTIQQSDQTQRSNPVSKTNKDRKTTNI